MITIERKTPMVLLVNGKTINVRGSVIIDSEKLRSDELKAVRNFIEATKRLKLKRSVLP